MHLGPGSSEGSPLMRPQSAHPRQEAQFYPTASAFIHLRTKDAFSDLGCDHWGWECGQEPAGLTPCG